MSVDELRRITPSFKKACDRDRHELLDPGLFDANLDVGARSFLMAIDENHFVTVGQPYLIRLDGERVVLQVEGRNIGRDVCVPPTILEAIRQASWPVTTGVILSFDPITGIADVALRAQGEAI